MKYKKINVGDTYMINGQKQRIEGIEGTNVVIYSYKANTRFIHGLETFKRSIKMLGYEFKERND